MKSLLIIQWLLEAASNGIMVLKILRFSLYQTKTVDFKSLGFHLLIYKTDVLKNRGKYPGNEHMGAFGCDSYDISGTVDGKGSNGALHGLTKFSMEDAPINMFFLEYIARPQTAEIFFEDILMACVFYGMPILAENNKPRLLYYFKRRGYRGFSINRPDKLLHKLSVTEREIGGIPNSSEDIKQAHAAAIESYINDFIGAKETGYGNMYFQKT